MVNEYQSIKISDIFFFFFLKKGNERTNPSHPKQFQVVRAFFRLNRRSTDRREISKSRVRWTFFAVRTYGVIC
jgi:hypothetical protein